MKALKLIILLTLLNLSAFADNGYRLWLKYDPIGQTKVVDDYRKEISSIYSPKSSETINIAINELKTGLKGLIQKEIPHDQAINAGSIVLLKEEDLSTYKVSADVPDHQDGYIIKNILINKKPVILISSKSDVGILYGVFNFLKTLQLELPIQNLSITEEPKIENRILNHWDNLDRTVERGYAGFSLWNWQTLPGHIEQRYIDYARANASIGINGTVLTNVNANSTILTPEWIQKVKALADAFRPYGIKVYLTARFSSPMELGKLPTADPLDPQVIDWWQKKAAEIYKEIPDFGGFLVKANSEGQPGPQDYGRNHADGANMLAKAVAPFNGIVMWRAFVYSNEVPDDRAKQAYNEFTPLDGKFDKNVLVQVKNGAIDFQPREPFHPLFGAMPKTPLMAELQLTQEYLGMSTNLAYLATLFEEVFKADTYAKGKGSTVGKIIDGSLENHSLSAIAGVANIGNDINWTGHPFAQSNWYAYGRLAWDHELTSEKIASEWIGMTFSTDKASADSIEKMMMGSREAIVNYMTPLGLHHLMGWNHHYGPGPWIKNKPRADWTSVYYHQADGKGIGFDRTATGSNAVAQYFPEVARQFANLDTCPEEYLLWFHHLPWDYKLKSGNTLWNEIVKHYYLGAEQVKGMQETWNALEGKVDPEWHNSVKQLLAIQYDEAVWWRNSCVLYFQSFSKLPIPENLPKPAHDLDYYENLEFKYVPGI
ncbi:alpha-glucuronidase family glycosyl hydrolase [Albibacterium sp.]|uniref:alpha-glucuronidase family glycosyl hydrolase n=1 Tax=Albibacterium sp. TaxID=2952885 RepID=UPI002D0F3E81|nr:alpha-glucuronidase family glycosyl hydrolase [Albibacterium sp.]HUH18438.1 alpha-glucuronidase family glycosyl hydrolase [Albibacterium sp.]